MPEFQDGLWLQQYVEPQLLEDFRNYNDNFIGVLKRANPAAVDKDGIKFNKLVGNVDFVVNASQDFTPKATAGKKTLVIWDALDTTPTEYTDEELRAMAFDKEAAIRVEHTNIFKLGVRDYAIHKIAPKKNVDGKTPVIRTTGEVINGRKRLTYNDLNTFLFQYITELNLTNQQACYLVLSNEHKADLVHDRANTNNYRDLEIDRNTGELKRFFNLQIFENTPTPLYGRDGNMKSMGSVKASGDQSGSIFFYAPNTVYHIEGVTVLAKPMRQDTRSKRPKAEVRLHTWGLCDKRQEHGFGAIVSDNE
ncbi:hypothetical protein CAPN002_23630 [Capnocytophaga stomatis]|nr:hypothetical protein [Capnocytophaga stomatis]GIJ95145.1 hypothetical protein CAPN002_23630 [Capnocytophaga stomatis]